MRRPAWRGKIKFFKITRNHLTSHWPLCCNRLRFTSKSKEALQIANVILAGLAARKESEAKKEKENL
jgi:hypothetical protein